MHGPLVTHILSAKGLDGGDRGRESVAKRLIQPLRMQAKRGKIAIAGKERGSDCVERANPIVSFGKSDVARGQSPQCRSHFHDYHPRALLALGLLIFVHIAADNKVVGTRDNGLAWIRDLLSFDRVDRCRLA